MTGDLVVATIPTVLILVVLWRGCRRVPDGQFAWWQERFEVTVATEDEAYVRSRLRRARVVRSGCAAVGVALAGLSSYLNLVARESAADFSGPVWGNAWVIGGALGAALAELLVLQRPARRAASLVRRRAGDYVDLRWARWVGGAVLLTAAATAVAAVESPRRWWFAPIGLAAALLSAGAMAVGLRSIVQRPALDSAGHLRAVDEALRADGAHHLVGACVALSGTAVVISSSALFLRGWPALLGLVGSFAGIWGLLMWMTLARQTRWSVAHARAASAVGAGTR